MRFNIVLVTGILGVVLLSGFSTSLESAFAREGGDVYTGSTSTLTPMSDPNACDTLVGEAAQCAVVDEANLPDPALAVILGQGGELLNPDACEFVLLSSGEALDNGPTLSTDMGGDTCRDATGAPETNPDGFETNDCATINITPDQNALVFFWSVEYPEFLDSDFSDWDRLRNGLDVSVSINDMVGHPTLNEDTNFDGGFANTLLASITEGTIAAGETVELRVADSGDFILDSGKIVVPIACLTEPNPGLLCGNDQLDPGEQCDDGNNQDGDGCSALCLDEIVPGGQAIPIDNAALLIAGIQSNVMWILSALVGIAGVAFGALYITTKRN